MTTEISYNEAAAEMQTAEETEASVPETPFCQHLRSKKYFMMDVLATDASQYMDGSNHCWCFETQQVVGPDGGKVAPPRCAPGRSCYQSGFAEVA